MAIRESANQQGDRSLIYRAFSVLSVRPIVLQRTDTAGTCGSRLMTLRNSSIIACLRSSLHRRLPADRYCDRTDRPAETPATAGTLFGARPLHAHEADVQLTRPAMSSNLQTSSNGVARNAVPSIATRRCSAPLRLRPRRTGLLGTARPRCTPPRRSFLTNAVTQSHGTPLGCHARKPRLIDSDPPPCIHSHDPECTPRGKRSRSVVSCKP